MPRGIDKKSKVLMIRTRMIKPADNPFFSVCDQDKLSLLAESIRCNGMVQPLVVMREPLELWYTLVSGRRRLEAAKRLELEEVPALVVPSEQAAYATLLENIYREEPSCFETASILASLVEKLAITDVAELAAKIGMPEQEVREKLKLLSMDAGRIEVCRAAGVTQEIANRIMAMPKSEQDKLFFGLLNPSRDIEERAWQLRDRMGMDAAEAPRRTIAVKDVRIFYNTIENAVDIMKQAGIDASTERNDYDGFVEYFIKIPSSNNDNKPQISVV